ncbi:MAG TPA: GNAT family N-acetyltransferase [Actinomycetota bacterium]|nr:GNAT family N-acetyltransferase [Actinomycetota bacterium]
MRRSIRRANPSVAGLAQARRFLTDFQVALSRRVAPWEWGTAYLHPGLPRVWDLNLLTIETAAGDVLDYVAAIDDILGPLGCEHRRFWVSDEALGHELAPAFERLGWDVDRHVIMALTGEPDRRVDTSIVRDVGRFAWRAREKQLRRYPWCDDDELVVEMKALYDSILTVLHARDLAVIEDGEPVSFALVYSDGTTAQIEDVGTLEEFRGRGLSRAIVQRAVDIVRESHELIFLVADDNDWPKDFYAKMGFEALGVEYFFLKTPERFATRT